MFFVVAVVGVGIGAMMPSGPPNAALSSGCADRAALGGPDGIIAPIPTPTTATTKKSLIIAPA